MLQLSRIFRRSPLSSATVLPGRKINPGYVPPPMSAAEKERQHVARQAQEEAIGLPEDVVEGGKVVIDKEVPRSYAILEASPYSVPGKWFLQFPEGESWHDRVMGWEASSNSQNQLSRLRFLSKEAAIAYCETHGFDWQLSPEFDEDQISKFYGEKFRYRDPNAGRNLE